MIDSFIYPSIYSSIHPSIIFVPYPFIHLKCLSDEGRGEADADLGRLRA